MAHIPGGDFQFTVDIARQDTGIVAVMDIPESKLIRFRAPEAHFVDGHVQVSVPPGWGLAMFRDIGLAPQEETLRFDGELAVDSIVGTVQVAYASFPLVLHRTLASEVPYRVETLTAHNGDVALEGSLYLPRSRGRAPVLVFTHGSGDRTRDAYAPEADRLARNGIGAFIYDKRGAGNSTGANWQVASFDELASDAVAVVRMLQARPEVDPSRVGLFGLSQGTWLIGMAAEQVPSVGFLVFASGSGIPVWEQEIYRTTAMMRAAGFSDAEVHEADAYQHLKFDVARTGLGWPKLDSATRALKMRQARWFDDYAQDYASLGSARFWWLAAFRYDPTSTLEHLRMPVLGLYGEKDLSFPVPTVVARMSTDLRKAGNCDVMLRVFPHAEHQLMIPQVYDGRTLRRIVTPDYMPLMINWIKQHAVPARPRLRCK
jgi:hypothetical protein